MLILDFDFVEKGVAAGIEERESWRAAFAMTVSLVWIYTNLLRILAIFSRTDQPSEAPVSASAGAGASASVIGWRRRWRSSTQRPRTPRREPPTWVPSSSVPGVFAASIAAAATGRSPSPRPTSGRFDRVEAEAQRGQRRRQQHVGEGPVALGRRVELVRAEQHRRGGVELRPEDRAERDGAAALLDDRDRLGRREPARPRPAHLLERRRDGTDRAEVGTRADQHLDARVPQPVDRVGEVAHRRGGHDGVGDVVDADQQHGQVGVGGQRAVDLTGQVPRLRAHHGELPEVHPTVGLGREAAREVGAGRLLDPVDAVAGGARVAEQRDLDRRPGPAAAVPAGGVGGRGLARARRSPCGRPRPRAGARRRGIRPARRGRPRRTRRQRRACVLLQPCPRQQPYGRGRGARAESRVSAPGP